jgi:hypothetical protein
MSFKWYVSVLVFSSKIDGQRTTSALDLQVRVLRAKDHEGAFARANEIGREKEHSYRNGENQTISCHFDGLHDLRELLDSEIADGSEVYSMLQEGDPENLIVSKDELTVFWLERNKHRTAMEILSGE